MSRRGLQIAVAVAGLVPVGAGLAGAVLGPAMVQTGGPMAGFGLDSHFRYLSGLLLGIGLIFWGMIPWIEHRTQAFRLLTAVVAVGGLSRLYGMVSEPIPALGPALPMFAALGMELVVTPALCLWQTLVARQASPSTSRMP